MYSSIQISFPLGTLHAAVFSKIALSCYSLLSRMPNFNSSKISDQISVKRQKGCYSELGRADLYESGNESKLLMFLIVFIWSVYFYNVQSSVLFSSLHKMKTASARRTRNVDPGRSTDERILIVRDFSLILYLHLIFKEPKRTKNNDSSGLGYYFWSLGRCQN